MRCPRFAARLRPSAVRVRIKSRSTSAKPPRTAIIKRPVLVAVSAHGSASDRNCALASHNPLDDGEEVEGAARQSVNPRHRHHVAGGEGLQHFEKLPPVVVRARHLLPVNLGGASGLTKLLKLAVEGLPVGADAVIADKAFFGVRFVHILCKP